MGFIHGRTNWLPCPFKITGHTAGTNLDTQHQSVQLQKMRSWEWRLGLERDGKTQVIIFCAQQTAAKASGYSSSSKVNLSFLEEGGSSDMFPYIYCKISTIWLFQEHLSSSQLEFPIWNCRSELANLWWDFWGSGKCFASPLTQKTAIFSVQQNLIWKGL